MAGEMALVVPRSDYRWTGLTEVTSTVCLAVPTTAEPADGTQEFLLPTQPGDTAKSLRIVPVMTAVLATSPKMRIVSWSRMTAVDGTLSYWPTVLAECNMTVSTGVTKPQLSIDGTACYAFVNLTVTRQVPSYSVPQYYSPGGTSMSSSDVATMVLDTIGGRYITLQFSASTGSMGALWAWF